MAFLITEQFWKEIQRYKITLLEKEKIEHKYFNNITKTLRPKPFKKHDTDAIDLLTSQFDDHASITKIKVCYPEIFDTFTFLFFVIVNPDSIQARLNSHYEARIYKKMKYNKIKEYRKSVSKEPTVKRCPWKT